LDGDLGVRQIGWLPGAALCLLTAACGSLGHEPSGDVLERLQSSGHVDRADRTVCQHTTPKALIPGDPPTVLATDRVSYKEVADAMRARGLDPVLKTVPKLPPDAAVTLCLLDTRGVPAAHAARVTYAVSGKSIWVADGQFK
jgi:hypothetical protein